MELSDIIIICLLLCCLTMWGLNFTTQCPSPVMLPPRIVYKYRPELDLQFSKENLPSQVYTNIFNGNNISQGGYNLLNTGRPPASQKNVSETPTNNN